MAPAGQAVALLLASADDRTAAALLDRQRERATPWQWVRLTPRALMQARWEQHIGAADAGWGLGWSDADEAPCTAAGRRMAAIDSRSVVWAWNRLDAAWDAEAGDPGYAPDDIAYAQSERQAQWVAALRVLGSRAANAAGFGEGLGVQPHPLHWMAAAVACGVDCVDFQVRTGRRGRPMPALSRIGGVGDGLDAADAPGWFRQRSGAAQRGWVFGTRYGGPGDPEFARRCAAFVASLGWACAALDLRADDEGRPRLAGVDACPAIGDGDIAAMALCDDWMQAEATLAAATTDVAP